MFDLTVKRDSFGKFDIDVLIYSFNPKMSTSSRTIYNFIQNVSCTFLEGSGT
jgi:hypothetical protein